MNYLKHSNAIERFSRRRPLHERVLYFIVYPAALAVLAWVLCN